jgi:hypothetical protein
MSRALGRSLQRFYGAPRARSFSPSVRTSVRDSQGSASVRFRRALDRENVTEALSAAAELPHVGLAEALELCLLIRHQAPERCPRAALRWPGRLCREVDVSLEEAQATLAALVLMAGDRKGNAAFALADLLSGRGLERPCETLVACARGVDLPLCRQRSITASARSRNSSAPSWLGCSGRGLCKSLGRLS